MTLERMQTHPGANSPPGEFERITASLLVARCVRCHGQEELRTQLHAAGQEVVDVGTPSLTPWPRRAPEDTAIVRLPLTYRGQRLAVAIALETVT